MKLCRCYGKNGASAKPLYSFENISLKSRNERERHILRLIEKAGQEYDVVHAEINARVERYFFEDMLLADAPEYTNCRTTLKSIRPQGWHFDILWNRESNAFGRMADGPDFHLWSPKLPTEELAEVHAIIQVTAYLRNRQ